MKKVVCILTAIILIASLTIPVNAGLVPLPVTDKEFLYDFVEYCYTLYGEALNYDELYYDELYYHYADDGEIDWALVRCGTNMESPMLYSAIIGNRVILHYSCAMPFESGYAVFDEGDKSFTDAALLTKAYDGFVKAFDENVTDGRLLGDIDNDGEISIIDVTMILRCDAEISEWSNDDVIAYLDDWNDHDQVYYSDFNRDGERDILDATCIQRYLADMPYSVG